VKIRGNKISLYCDLMREIRKRDEVIRGFCAGGCYTLYMATTLESMCLQVRKTLELIALGSLVVNKNDFAKFHRDFQKYWHGGRILKDIERINPKFYPVPIEEVSCADTNMPVKWEKIKEGYLTKDDFVKVYEKCGKILHADNPFGSKTDYSYYQEQIKNWRNKIVKLLSSHQIHLLNDKNIYLIHMKEKKDGQVKGYTFAPV